MLAKRWWAAAVFVSMIASSASCSWEGGAYDRTTAWDETPAVTVKPVRRVAGERRFASVGAFAADSAGHVFIGDTYGTRVVALDSTGTVVWQHAMPAAGVLAAMGVAFGEVAVVDRMDQIATILDARDGSVRRSFAYKAMTTASFTNGQPVVFSGSGGTIAFGIGNVFDDRHNAKYPGLPGWDERLIRLSEDDSTALELPDWPGILIPLPSGGSREWGYRPPLVPRLVWTPNPMGGWTGGDGYAYRITVRDRDGSEVRRLERDVGPRRPSDGARKKERKIFDELARSYPVVRHQKNRLLGDTVGQFTTMAYSRDGRHLWVGRTYLDANPVYDVWDAEGRFLCSVRLDMDGDEAVLRRAVPFIVNGRLYHAASRGESEPVIDVFEVSHACDAAAGREGPT